MASTAFTANWARASQKCKNCIDIASVIYAWNQFDPESEPEQIYRLICQLMADEIRDFSVDYDKQREHLISGNILEPIIGVRVPPPKVNFNVLEYRAIMSNAISYKDYDPAEDYIDESYPQGADGNEIGRIREEHRLKHPILSDRAITLRFIDLEKLVSKLKPGSQYPEQLLSVTGRRQSEPTQIKLRSHSATNLELDPLPAASGASKTQAEKQPASTPTSAFGMFIALEKHYNDLNLIDRKAPGAVASARKITHLSYKDAEDALALVKCSSSRMKLPASQFFYEVIKGGFELFWSSEHALAWFNTSLDERKELTVRQFRAKFPNITDGAVRAILRGVAPRAVGRTKASDEDAKNAFNSSFDEARQFCLAKYEISLSLHPRLTVHERL